MLVSNLQDHLETVMASEATRRTFEGNRHTVDEDIKLKSMSNINLRS